MAYGTKGYRETGAVMAAADFPYGGDLDRQSLVGISPEHPLMGGQPRVSGGLGQFDVDRATSPAPMIATIPGGSRPQDTPAVFDDWRDLFDFKNSPAPYVCLLALAMIGLVQFRVVARGGPAKASASLG